MFQVRRYTLELGGALAVYGLLLVGAAAVEKALSPVGALKLAIYLAPMIGAVLGAWAILRGLHRMDELQRKIQFDAIALSFLGTALITFGWGFAEGAGLPKLSAFAVWPIMGTLWAAALPFSTRRYR